MNTRETNEQDVIASITKQASQLCSRLIGQAVSKRIFGEVVITVHFRNGVPGGEICGALTDSTRVKWVTEDNSRLNG